MKDPVISAEQKEKIGEFAAAASRLNRQQRRILLGKLKRKRRKIQRARIRFEKKHGKIPGEKQTPGGTF